MGPIWGRQDPGGPHVGPMNFAICETAAVSQSAFENGSSSRCIRNGHPGFTISKQNGDSYPQVWRQVTGYTYKIIHHTEHVILVTGFLEFMLSPEKRDFVKAGDVLGLFTYLSDENQIIGHNTIYCDSPTLKADAGGITSLSPSAFQEESVCRHYSLQALFAGKTHIRMH